ncbi:MAG TPA: hypothetical protein VFQ30_15800 [Ktedonobacteraceae bacterium]|nr:hypothetical protein [Ktedonobacteraceae bacterium]
MMTGVDFKDAHLREPFSNELSPHEEVQLRCEECQIPLWKAGEIVAAGTYVRVDDDSYRVVILNERGPLPATFDGHIALYCVSACTCKNRAAQQAPR